MSFVYVLLGLVVAIVIIKLLLTADDSSRSSGASPRARSSAKSSKSSGKMDSRKRFISIDFETANDRYFSACSLGLVVFDGFEPVYRKSWLINPHTKFDSVNISIHHITPEMVADAPTFAEIWPELYSYLDSCRVVGYSDFDAKVLKSLIKHWKISISGNLLVDYFDVCQCSRDTIIGLTNYKLPTVCQYLGISGLDHHNASSDAEACGKIYCWLMKNGGKQRSASRGVPASYAQQDYIRSLGGDVPPVLTRSDASLLIDQLIQDRACKQEEESEARRAAREQKREEERNAKMAAKVYDRRKKEEDALCLLADEMNDPNFKLRRSRSKRIQDLKEFQVLVNNVISDGIIEPSEILRIKAWLIDHKVLEDDFSEMLLLIDKSLLDQNVDDIETQPLYEGMLDCITTLRKRQST